MMSYDILIHLSVCRLCWSLWPSTSSVLGGRKIPGELLTINGIQRPAKILPLEKNHGQMWTQSSFKNLFKISFIRYGELT